MAPEAIVSVLVPFAVAAPYTYRAPAGTVPGDIVEAPLGSRSVVGVVWDDPPDPSVRAVASIFATSRVSVVPMASWPSMASLIEP